MVRECDGQDSYIRRESLGDLKGGSGISHILFDSYVEEMYVGGCVDKIIASGACATDHHMVWQTSTSTWIIFYLLSVKLSSVSNGERLPKLSWTSP